MSIIEEEPWPTRDAELTARLAAAPDRLLHRWMCECVEHAIETCLPLSQPAGYFLLPETTPIEVKRRWLAGEATDADLERAQYHGVKECYWGNPIALGAAILGVAWYPGSGIAVAEDEHYAESMTYHPSAAAAACDVMSECLEAVMDMALRACHEWEDRGAASEMFDRTADAERAWQRERFFAMCREAGC